MAARKVFVLRQLIQYTSSVHLEEEIGIETLLGKQTVIGGPIRELSPAGGQETGDGVTPQTNQHTQGESLGSCP